MHTPVRTVILLAAAVGVWGCSSLNQGPGRDRNVISPEEIAASEARNAYELILRLRPLWLQSRGDRSTRLETAIVVYQNDTMLGGVDTLENIPIEMVHSVRALSAAEAGQLAGLGSRHVERAIMILTRSGE